MVQSVDQNVTEAIETKVLYVLPIDQHVFVVWYSVVCRAESLPSDRRPHSGARRAPASLRSDATGCILPQSCRFPFRSGATGPHAVAFRSSEHVLRLTKID